MKLKLTDSQSGFSIMEFMVGTALSGLLLISLAELFNNHRLTHQSQEGLARIQENGRFAIYMLTKDIRMAGYQGCDGTGSITPNIVADPLPTGFSFDSDNFIKGYEGSGSSWSPSLPSSLSGSVLAGTDVISVSLMAPVTDIQVTKMVQPTSNIKVDGRSGIEQDEVVMITDCDTADIFRVTNVSGAAGIAHGAAGNTGPALQKAYQSGASVGSLSWITYYIKDSGRTNNQGDAIYSLYQLDINGDEFELVEGIENMQITYGYDTDGDHVADTYEGASAIDANSNWSKVITVKLSLLVNSVEDTALTPQDYYYNGVSGITATDKKMRKNWDLFVTIRNRQLGL